MEGMETSSLHEAIERVDCDSATLHEILANDRRRRVLAQLYESARPMRLSTLAEEIARVEKEGDRNDLPDVEQIHQALYHNHIARMADAGVVTYDSLRDTAELANVGYTIAQHLTCQASCD